MSESKDISDRFAHYLAVKKSVDDRSLNRLVVEALQRSVETERTLQVLEVGAGIGTMIERLLQWKLLRRADYTAVDAAAALLPAARRYLHNAAVAHGWQWMPEDDRSWRLSSQCFDLQIHWQNLDITGDEAAAMLSRNFDLLIAHAVLDLMDLETTLGRMQGWIRPEGLLYLTLNFDGETLLLPEIDAALDSRIIELYHRSMDERRIRGRPSGSSRTGRLLLQRLTQGGAHVLAAGSSDWIVYPQPDRYADDEAAFLHYLIDTIAGQLHGEARIAAAALQKWTRERHRQVAEGRLVFIAKQLDVLARLR